MAFPDDDRFRMEQRIIDRLAALHPEYGAPSAAVTGEFLRLVLRTYDDVVAAECPGLEGLPPADLADDEARELLESLPGNALGTPLSVETVRAILEVFNGLSCEWYLRGLLECPCADAADYNNRANAQAHCGDREGALAGYGLAAALDPNDIVPLLNRAQLLVRLERMNDALDTATRVFSLLARTGPEHWQEHLTLSHVLLQCGRPMQAAMCLNRCLSDLMALSPYISRGCDGGYLLDKDDGDPHIAAMIDFAELSDLARRIGGAFSADPGWGGHLIDRVAEVQGLVSGRPGGWGLSHRIVPLLP